MSVRRGPPERAAARPESPPHFIEVVTAIRIGAEAPRLDIADYQLSLGSLDAMLGATSLLLTRRPSLLPPGAEAAHARMQVALDHAEAYAHAIRMRPKVRVLETRRAVTKLGTRIIRQLDLIAQVGVGAAEEAAAVRQEVFGSRNPYYGAAGLRLLLRAERIRRRLDRVVGLRGRLEALVSGPMVEALVEAQRNLKELAVQKVGPTALPFELDAPTVTEYVRRHAMDYVITVLAAAVAGEVTQDEAALALVPVLTHQEQQRRGRPKRDASTTLSPPPPPAARTPRRSRSRSKSGSGPG